MALFAALDSLSLYLLIDPDLSNLDVTDVPRVAEGDRVVLLGSNGDAEITAAELAAIAGTIPYEILCAVSPRVPRVYVHGRTE